MSRPWKHPNSGVYWLRKRVPDDLRALIGKREEKRSLGTRNPEEAKRRHAQLMTELDERWKNLRAGPRNLTEREAQEIAATIYEQYVAKHSENPSEQTFWNVRIGENLWANKPMPRLVDEKTMLEFINAYDPDEPKKYEMKNWCLNVAQQELDSHGLAANSNNKTKLAHAISTAMQNASLTLARYTRGDFTTESHSSGRRITKQLFPKDGSTILFPKPDPRVRDNIKAALHNAVSGNSRGLSQAESRRLKTTLANFSGSSAAGLILSNNAELAQEVEELTHLLQAASAMTPHAVGEEAADDALKYTSEKDRRAAERRNMLFHQILDRYSTRDLVARYDGATKTEERDRHLRGFNSPYAPFVLIASSVGQEGIDLQKFCRHVIHYDLEWNPAKLEQREGRVDRQGRETDGAVNVYFLLCRGTYDERLMHVMTNRFRWHQVLLGNKHALEGPPGSGTEASSDPGLVKKMTLNLSPPKR